MANRRTPGFVSGDPRARGPQPTAIGGRPQPGGAYQGGPTSRGPPKNPAQNDAYLRRQLGIPPQVTKLDLWALRDSPPHVRPTHTLEVLAKLAIHGVALDEGADFEGCTFAEVCEEIAERFPYFKRPDSGSWRTSVRHVLSKKMAFRRTEDPSIKPGKWWLDFSDGEGDKKPRKRGSRSSSDFYSDDSDDE